VCVRVELRTHRSLVEAATIMRARPLASVPASGRGMDLQLPTHRHGGRARGCRRVARAPRRRGTADRAGAPGCPRGVRRRTRQQAVATVLPALQAPPISSGMDHEGGNGLWLPTPDVAQRTLGAWRHFMHARNGAEAEAGPARMRRRRVSSARARSCARPLNESGVPIAHAPVVTTSISTDRRVDAFPCLACAIARRQRCSSKRATLRRSGNLRGTAARRARGRRRAMTRRTTTTAGSGSEDGQELRLLSRVGVVDPTRLSRTYRKLEGTRRSRGLRGLGRGGHRGVTATESWSGGAAFHGRKWAVAPACKRTI